MHACGRVCWSRWMLWSCAGVTCLCRDVLFCFGPRQIVLYLLSRIIIGFCKTMAAQGVQPFCSTTFDKAYPYLATVVWACVMWLFENRRFSLHRSLAVSMDFLYHDANTWKKLADFLPSPATVAVLVYYFVYATVQKKARGGRRS